MHTKQRAHNEQRKDQTHIVPRGLFSSVLHLKTVPLQCALDYDSGSCWLELCIVQRLRGRACRPPRHNAKVALSARRKLRGPPRSTSPLRAELANPLVGVQVAQRRRGELLLDGCPTDETRRAPHLRRHCVRLVVGVSHRHTGVDVFVAEQYRQWGSSAVWPAASCRARIFRRCGGATREASRLDFLSISGEAESHFLVRLCTGERATRGRIFNVRVVWAPLRTTQTALQRLARAARGLLQPWCGYSLEVVVHPPAPDRGWQSDARVGGTLDVVPRVVPLVDQHAKLVILVLYVVLHVAHVSVHFCQFDEVPPR